MNATVNPSDPLATVVVVPHERFGGSAASLESLYANTPEAFRLVYIDGGSPRDVRTALECESKRRGFELIRVNHLLLANEARNLGLQRVGTRYAAFVDNDLRFTPGWLGALVDAAERSGAWLVGSLMLEGSGEAPMVRVIADETRLDLDEHGQRRLAIERSAGLWPLSVAREKMGAGWVDRLESRAVLVRTDRLREIGGWDEGLLGEHELLDLCLRVRVAGGQVRLEAGSVVAPAAPAPLRRTDRPLFLLRWGDDGVRRSGERFDGKFALHSDAGAGDERLTVAVSHRRRVLFEEGSLRWIRRGLRRRRDGQYHSWVRKLMARMEQAIMHRAMHGRPGVAAAGVSFAGTLPLTAALLGSVHAPPGGHIAMFHIGRCGSTVLGDLLGQHPLLKWDGEVYEPKSVVWSRYATAADAADPLGFLARRVAAAGKPRYGFEIKFYQARMVNLPLETLVPRLDAMGFTHFIILRRRNFLRKVVSSIVAHASSRWHVPAGSVATLQRVVVPVDGVRIDHTVAPLLDLLRGYDADLRRIESLLAGRPVLKIEYEEHLEHDPSVGYRAVCGFLGIEAPPAAVRLGRTTPFSLREVIENFDEVAAALRGTEFEWMAGE